MVKNEKSKHTELNILRWKNSIFEFKKITANAKNTESHIKNLQKIKKRLKVRKCRKKEDFCGMSAILCNLNTVREIGANCFLQAAVAITHDITVD